MLRRQSTAQQSRGVLRSLLGIGAALAGLLAVTVAVAAWGSAKSESAVKSASSNARAASSKLTGKQCSEDKAAGTIDYVSPFSYSASAGVIDVVEAQKLGYFTDLCLKVNFIANSNDPQTLVENNRAQISSTANADNVMNFDATGGDRVVGVETLANGISPLTIIESGKGKTLKDLKGKTLGYYNELYPAYLAMLHKAGIPFNDVKFVTLTNFDPISALKEVTGLGAFLGSQDLILDAAHQSYTEIKPSQYGVTGTDTVYYMNKAFVKKYPTAAANFLRAQIKSLDYCLANKLACEKYVGGVATAAGDGASYGVTEDEGVWNYSADSILKPHLLKPVGTFSASDWTAEYDIIKTYGQEAAKISGEDVKLKVPPISDMINTKMVAGLYSHGKLVWP